jgi:tetratricopeptide (TPR) repeat protein
MAVQDVKAAEQRFQDGIAAIQEGNLERAVVAFGDAEIRFRLAGDFKRAGDSRQLIADAQRQNSLLEQATNSYTKAIKLYQQANRPLNEAGATLALGHIERQQAHLDGAQEAYQRAWHLYAPLDSTQGLGNATLALGHIEMQRGRIETAAVLYQ